MTAIQFEERWAPVALPRRRAIVALAVLALVALLAIDCCNATGESTWSDITKAPHMAAITGSAWAARVPVARPGLDRRVLSVFPAPAVAVPGALLLGVLLLLVAVSTVPVTATGPPRRGPPRRGIAGVPT